MIKFDILNRLTGAVQFTTEIDCEEDSLTPIKMDLAVKWAIKTGADLSNAVLRNTVLRNVVLSNADLSYVNLSGVNLSYANLSYVYGISDRIIDGGIRSDGYRFLLTRTDPGEWRVKAGCRNYGLKEARKHWNATRPKGEALGDETRLIIKNMVAIAKLRKWALEGIRDEKH